MNPRLNLHVARQTEFNNRRRDLFEFSLLIIPSRPPPPMCPPWDEPSSLSRSFLATVGRSWLTRCPCGAVHETGRRRGKENLTSKGSAVRTSHLQLKTQRTRTAGIFQTLDALRSQLPREDKLALNAKINWLKTNQTKIIVIKKTPLKNADW